MATTIDADQIVVAGVPGSQPPELEELTAPQGSLPPKADQSGPERLSPTGCPLKVGSEAVAQQGAYLTTASGTRLPDSDHSLKAGPRGPVLLQDHHLRENSPPTVPPRG
jgi:catalase